MILEKEVKMVINQYNIDYYKKVLNTDLSIGERVMIPINLLPSTSGVKITTICEYCGKHVQKPYRRYIESKNKGKVCCGACKEQKILENCINKYGQRCSLLVPEYHEKMIENNLKKYGTKHNVTSESIKKMQETMLIKYGAKGSTGSLEIREKINKTMFLNGKESGVFTSKQQIYINKLVGGELNYPIGPYHVDIFLLEQNIGIEYSGSGHDLGVKIGRISQKQFDKQEKVRYNYFKNHKIPIIEIFSKNDKLPSDDILLKQIYKAIDYIKTSASLYYIIDIDNIPY